MHDPISDSPSPTRDAFKQGLRLRRFLLASAFSVLYLLVLAIFYTQDKIDRETLLEACAIVAALILVFFGLFRLGLNLRFARSEPDRMAVACGRVHDAVRRLPRSGHPTRLHRLLLRRADVRHASPQRHETRRARLRLVMARSRW